MFAIPHSTVFPVNGDNYFPSKFHRYFVPNQTEILILHSPSSTPYEIDICELPWSTLHHLEHNCDRLPTALNNTAGQDR